MRECLLATGAIGKEQSKLYTLHSFRRYLACALLAAGVADARIQALLRWKTGESLKIYATLNDGAYGEYLERAGKADVTSVRTRALPRTDALEEAMGHIAQANAVHQSAQSADGRAPAADLPSDDGSDTDDEPDAATQRPAPASSGELTRERRMRGAAALQPEPTAQRPERLMELQAAPSVGEEVVIPRALWPSAKCTELGGAGWLARVRARHRDGSVTVRYAESTTRAGAPIESRLQTRVLRTRSAAQEQ